MIVLPAALQQRGQLPHPSIFLLRQAFPILSLPLLPLLLDYLRDVALLVSHLDLSYPGCEEFFNNNSLVLPPGIFPFGEDDCLPIVLHLFYTQLYLSILSTLPLSYIYLVSATHLIPFILLPYLDELVLV